MIIEKIDAPDGIRKGRGMLYPEISRLEVGGGCLRVDIKDRQKVINAAWHYAKRHGVKFISRTQKDGDVKVCRIWRVE